MKTEDVISIALASGMYQDDEMFFSPSTGEADVHISDLEYFAKLVKERTLSKQKAGYYQEGYEAGQHDMFTKLQNVDTSEKRVHGTDKSIHEPWDTSDMAYRPNGLSVEQEKLCKYCLGIGRVVCDGRCMPEQEPVAWVSDADFVEGQFVEGRARRVWWECNTGVGQPLYTALPKREWVSLTDEEIDYLEDAIDPAMYRVFARRIEAKLKEKNHD
jgi:hypothetical protein